LSSATIQKLLCTGKVDIEALNNHGLSALMQACIIGDLYVGAQAKENVICLIEGGCTLGADVPQGYRYPSVDEAIFRALSEFVKQAFVVNPSSEPIPARRRTLRWALTSESVERALPVLTTSTSAKDSKEVSSKEIDEMRKTRLSLLREDAWKRRRHLCLDRALWRKPATAYDSSKKAKVEVAAGASE
jgi:hypothetical protein